MLPGRALPFVLLGLSLWAALGCTGWFTGCGEREPQCGDQDNDGFTACDDASGSDCNDLDPDVNPDAREVCDEVDNDCDGTVDADAADREYWHRDADQDGYGDVDGANGSENCNPPAGYSSTKDDCDDSDETVHPAAVEICDGLDNDCDGEVDNATDGLSIWYADADGDGYGSDSSTLTACDAPVGYIDRGGDCDDSDAAISPLDVEICNSGVNEDCQAATPDACSYAIGDTTVALLGGDYGHRTEEAAGAAVANAGDIDEDGFDDSWVGAAGAGAAPAGVYLVLGPLSGMGSLSDASAHLETGTDGDLAGSAVAGAQDVDADGHPDLVFGAPGTPGAAGNPGAAWLLYGPDFAACSPFCSGALIAGESDGDAFGSAVALVGDVDGDGLDDVLVGEPGKAGGGGAACFLDAPMGSLDVSSADARFTGEGTGAAGTAVLGAGDVDGDGRDDLGIVDPAGAVAWIVTGGPEGTLALADSAARIHVPVGDDTLSRVVLDDLDGDGAIDLLASALHDASQAVDTVAWGAFGPLTGSVEAGEDLTVSTGGLYCNGGVSVVSLGDLDFDGSADLVFSAPDAKALLPPDYSETVQHGAALWARPGPLTGPAGLAEGATRFDVDEYAVPFPGGDVNGDLRPDLLLGAPEDDTTATDAGAFGAMSGAQLF